MFGSALMPSEPQRRSPFSFVILADERREKRLPSQVVTGPSKVVTGPSQVVTGPSQVVTGPSKVVTVPRLIQVRGIPFNYDSLLEKNLSDEP